MTKHLIALGVLFVAGVAGAQSPEGGGCYTDADGDDWCVEQAEIEDDLIFYSSDYALKFAEPLSCITVEFCGDPEEDSDVRCVRAPVCGEPIR